MLCGNLNRLTDVVYPDTTTVRYAYNELSLRTYQSNNVARIWYGYDNMNRLVSSTSSVESACLPGCGATGTVSAVVNYFHDLNGNRTNIVYPGSVAVGYAFDAANRLSQLQASALNLSPLHIHIIICISKQALHIPTTQLQHGTGTTPRA